MTTRLHRVLRRHSHRRTTNAFYRDLNMSTAPDYNRARAALIQMYNLYSRLEYHIAKHVDANAENKLYEAPKTTTLFEVLQEMESIAPKIATAQIHVDNLPDGTMMKIQGLCNRVGVTL